MALYSPEHTVQAAQENLDILAANPYPGRLLVVGFSGQAAVQAYAIEGRSCGSRNRVFAQQDNIVSTEIADTLEDVGDPQLTIYDAMRQVGDVHVVSNGAQTNTVAQYLRSGRSFAEAMGVTEHEPDKPNYTPRITAFIDEGAGHDEYPRVGISVIRRNPETAESVRSFYTDNSPKINLSDGVGYAVHTYRGDGNPLPSFNVPPFSIPVKSDATEMAEMLWNNLDLDNRVSVAAKTIVEGVVDICIINQYPKVVKG